MTTWYVLTMLKNWLANLGRDHKNLVLVVNISGGKDSTEMLRQLVYRYPSLPIYAIYADTGFEHVKPVSAEAWCAQQCVDLGVPFYVVRNPNKTYLQMVERRRMFPSPSNRQCTSDLKRDPIQKWIRQNSQAGRFLHGKVIINCTGIRAQESAARAKQRPLKREARLCAAGRVVWNWMPIFRRTLVEVLDNLEAADLPLHPVYSYRGNGGYLRRFSCRVCIFSTDADLCAIHEHDLEAFNLVADLEVRIGFTMRSGRSLRQIVANKAAAQGKQYGDEEADEVPCMAA